MYLCYIAKIKAVLKAFVTRRLTLICDRISYDFKNVPYRKLWNWFIVEASVLFQPLKPWGWPTHLQIEPTNLCNLNCVLCPVSGEMKRSKGYLDPGVFNRLIDEIGSCVFFISLWDWGEPFLHPHIYDMIAYAKARGIKIASSTNGHLFSQPENADRVIKSGLDTLIFAVDGISQQTYEAYRKSGDLKTVLKGIRTVVERRRILGLKSPTLNFRFIVMRHNEHEVPLLKDFAAELGVDVLTIKTLNPSSDDTYGEKGGIVAGKDHPLLPLDQRWHRFRYDKDTKAPVRRKKNACKNLWNASTLHWNGVVCPCTYDFDEHFPLGDMHTQSFKEIWSSQKYQEMRRIFRQQSEDNRFCYECSYAYVGGSCMNETVTDAYFLKPQGQL